LIERDDLSPTAGWQGMANGECRLEIEDCRMKNKNMSGECCGGRWNKFAGYWELPYREAVSSGLDNRITKD